VKNSEKKWFQPGSWNTLLTENQTFCQNQKLDPRHCPKNFDKARRLWESQYGQSMSLPQAMDLCRKCHEMKPFIFNNGNTFAAFARNLVEDWAKAITAVEAQMLRTTIGHYVTGQANRKELLQVLNFLAPSWERFQAAPVLMRPEPAASQSLQTASGQQLLAS
jgi:hypothetical protein